MLNINCINYILLSKGLPEIGVVNYIYKGKYGVIVLKLKCNDLENYYLHSINFVFIRRKTYENFGDHT